VAADLAEHTAVEKQLAELDGPRSTVGVIAGLELAADMLRYAAEALSPPPLASRQVAIESLQMTGLYVISCVAVLLAVPDPADPLVLAAAFVGSPVLAKAAWDLFDAIRDRRRTHTPPEPRDTWLAIAEVRTMILATTRVLEPDRDDRHVEAGRRIESAKVWLDSAELALARQKLEADPLKEPAPAATHAEQVGELPHALREAAGPAAGLDDLGDLADSGGGQGQGDRDDRPSPNCGSEHFGPP
jgi:hypothetical protein